MDEGRHQEDNMAQKWKRGLKDEEGYFTIKHHSSGKVLTATSEGLTIEFHRVPTAILNEIDYDIEKLSAYVEENLTAVRTILSKTLQFAV